jgi:hypothetical protein
MLLFLWESLLYGDILLEQTRETAFYLFAIPISAVFLIVIGVKIALAFSGR